MAERLHKEGPGFIKTHDPDTRKRICKDMGLKFTERIQHLANTFSVVEARCDSLLKGGELEFFVAAPKHLLPGSSGMIKQNEEESRRIKIGRSIKRTPNAIKSVMTLTKTTTRARRRVMVHGKMASSPHRPVRAHLQSGLVYGC